MATVRIQPSNPHDFNSEELADLMNEVHSRVDGVDIDIQEKVERGYGVTLYEVIQVIADVRGAGGDLVLIAVAEWLRRRWKRDKDAGRNPRPRAAELLDLEGNKLKSVEIDEPDGEPKNIDPTLDEG